MMMCRPWKDGATHNFKMQKTKPNNKKERELKRGRSLTGGRFLHLLPLPLLLLSLKNIQRNT